MKAPEAAQGDEITPKGTEVAAKGAKPEIVDEMVEKAEKPSKAEEEATERHTPA